MRSERHSADAVAAATGYRFHFQITNGGGRHACTVEVQAPSMQDATVFFRKNWAAIEAIARESLTGEAGADKTIKLAVP